jgi:hypothetical protein
MLPHAKEAVRQFTPNWFTATRRTGILALALNQAPFATPALFVAPCLIRGAIPGDLEADFVWSGSLLSCC